VLPVLAGRHDLAPSCPAARQPVGHHNPWSLALPFEQPAQQASGRLRVAAALDKDIEHHPSLVHRAPRLVLYPRDRERDLVQVPLVPSRKQPAPDLAGKRLCQADSLHDQRLIHHAQAQGKAEVEPDGVADDLNREAVNPHSSGGEVSLFRPLTRLSPISQTRQEPS
jgi:hypothetical protein